MAAQMSGTLSREKTVAEVGGRWGGRRGWGSGEYLLKNRELRCGFIEARKSLRCSCRISGRLYIHKNERAWGTEILDVRGCEPR